MFDRFSAYPEDEPLLRELGLLVPINQPLNQAINLGKVIIETNLAKVKCAIAVTACPDQFFAFDVQIDSKESGEVRHLKLSTGSGPFQKYWWLIKLFLSMLSEGIIKIEA